MMTQHAGWVEVIHSGAMYAGKTKELLRRLDRAKWARQSFIVVKPILDNRYHTVNIVTHTGESLTAHPVVNPYQIIPLTSGIEIVAIDEANFFPPSLVPVVQTLCNLEKRVIIAGLSITSEGEPFGCMPNLLAIADDITTLHGVCACCGASATKTKALIPKKDVIHVGGKDEYEPRCNKCWRIKIVPN